MEVLGIAEARATLPAIVDRLATDKEGRVVIGSHRKPQAMIVPYGVDTGGAVRPTLESIRSRGDLIRRIASTSKISAVAVFGSVARGEEGLDSTIDFVVDVEPEASLSDVARFGRDMELLFNIAVGVVERTTLDPIRNRGILDDSISL